MTEWRVLSNPELVELVGRLRTLEWSWRLADAAQLATEFGWEVERSRPNWVVLDIGFGSSSGEISGDNGVATEIVLEVTGSTTDDAAGRSRSRAAFTEMTAALTAEFGAPTTRVPGATPEVRWAGTTTTAVLRDLGMSVVVRLVTNEKLAIEDEIEELDEEELL
ncbi:DUF6301 family protein [Nocardia carnea]|uniref:DUF6301 family protein n=1 Tax=Nocardia carnea TaxID=37328 RepID=UPI0024556009|nr:DUF6301 family protein [Nocardia carnea]